MKLKIRKLNDLFDDSVFIDFNDNIFDIDIYYQGYCYDDSYRIKNKYHFVDDEGHAKNYKTLSCLVYAFIERIDDKHDMQDYSSYVLKYTRHLNIDYWSNDNNENLTQKIIINQGQIKYSDLDLKNK